MCLVAMALGQSPRFPVVMASNRDEFFDRPAAGLDWWTPPGGGPALLAGRDLRAGGTWFGLNAAGRLALVTNVRASSAVRAAAPSRGELVPHWLRSEASFDACWREWAGAGYNGFNLVAADLAAGEWTWASNTGRPPQRLVMGLYGLSNAALDTPWRKTERLKHQLRAALQASETGESAEALASKLFRALADRRIAGDDDLPATGIPLDRERELSAAFIRTTDGRYGTRYSTVLITERIEGRSITQVFERSFDNGEPGALRRTRLLDWPAAPGAIAQAEAVVAEAPPAQTGADRRP
ncbi:NRDE family protein [Methylibium sp.]|uniref:NRDE family protein n=1 Tax=Methylibium sp. TaxID=2067992 RepID=UPI0017973CE4|nr:NRDE family protein [Methylibium sp.]MBA3589816.1 NRDE family protein [Methylibium sp.]